MSFTRKRPAKYLRETIKAAHGVRVKWTYYHRRRMAIVTMNSNQKFTVTLHPEDALGNPGSLDSPPTWATDKPGIVTLQIASDGLSCIVLGEAAGTCWVTPSATSGGGVNHFSGAPTVVTVLAAPLAPATQLVEDIGPVVNQ